MVSPRGGDPPSVTPTGTTGSFDSGVLSPNVYGNKPAVAAPWVDTAAVVQAGIRVRAEMYRAGREPSAKGANVSSVDGGNGATAFREASRPPRRWSELALLVRNITAKILFERHYLSTGGRSSRCTASPPIASGSSSPRTTSRRRRSRK
jgi:hypothetical protein